MIQWNTNISSQAIMEPRGKAGEEEEGDPGADEETEPVD